MRRLCAAIDEIDKLLDLFASLVSLGLGLAVIDMGDGNDEIEPSGAERSAIGHAVELVSLMEFRRHVEADIAGEPGRNDGPLVVEKGKPFVIAGRVRDQYASIARQALLQVLQPAQVGFHFLQRDEVEPFADIGDLLDRTIGVTVGEMLDVPARDDQVLGLLPAQRRVGLGVHHAHQRLALQCDGFSCGRHWRVLPYSFRGTALGE